MKTSVPLWNRITSLLRNPARDSEEGPRKLFCGVILALGSPFLLGFACLHFLQGEVLRAAILAFTGAGMLGILFLLATSRLGKGAVRLCLGLLGGFSLYLVLLAVRFGNTDRLLFLLLLPVFAFFTSGKREGLVWVAGIPGLWIPFLLAPFPLLGTTPPPAGFVLRFMATFLVLSVTAYAFECIRERHRRAAETERASLAAEVLKRRRFEQELADSERKYRALFEDAGDAILLCRAGEGDLQVKACNDAAVRMFGGRREDIVGKRSEAFDALDRDASARLPERRRRILAALSEGRSQSIEWRHRRLSGDPFDSEVVLSPMDLGEGPHVLGIIRDVSEQKRTLIRLKKSEERFRELSALLPEIVFETDSEGVLTFVNDNAYQVTGYSPRDLAAGFSALSLIAPEDVPGARANMQSRLEGGASQQTEYMGVRKDGSRFPILVRSQAIIRDGETVGLRGLIVDITDRKKAREEAAELQARLKQAEKMEAIGTLAGGIAHDFNNILAVIQGFSELALQEATPSGGQSEALQEVLEASKRAKNLVQQILTFSRQGECERASLDLQGVFKGTLKHVRTNLPGTISLRERLGAENATVLGNVVEMHQMLVHLCRNAQQAMRERGGILDVALTRETVDAEAASRPDSPPAGRYLKLTVQDTGEGMEEGVLARVFDPFFTTRRTGEGSGLGLAVVYGTVQEAGGTVRVASEPGKGSTFTIWLPESDGKGQGDPVAPAQNTSAGGRSVETILVVDDEPPLRRMLRRMLEKDGYRVLEASNGREALRVFADEHVDVVITDLFMPEKDGLETIREIRNLSPEAGILAISGGGKTVGQDLLPYAEMLGAQRVLAKPLKHRDLLEAIQAIRGVR